MSYISRFASHGILIQKELATKCEKYEAIHWQETFSSNQLGPMFFNFAKGGKDFFFSPWGESSDQYLK
jgi:hypothetical protein